MAKKEDIPPFSLAKTRMLESLAKLSNILAKMDGIIFYYQPVARYVQ